MKKHFTLGCCKNAEVGKYNSFKRIMYNVYEIAKIIVGLIMVFSVISLFIGYCFFGVKD